MKFLVLMYADPTATVAMSKAERADVLARHEALHRELEGTGEMLNGAGLALPGDTVTLRWRGDVGAGAGAEAGAGARAADVSAGPVTEPESGLHATAYYVVECESADRAREIAERVLDFHVVAIEVRPIHDWFGMGDDPVGDGDGGA